MYVHWGTPYYRIGIRYICNIFDNNVLSNAVTVAVVLEKKPGAYVERCFCMPPTKPKHFSCDLFHFSCSLRYTNAVWWSTI